MTEREFDLEAALRELLNAVDTALVDWEDAADAGLLAAANKAREVLERKELQNEARRGATHQREL